MNAIFKVIWNISLNVWVAVGEFAKGKQKSKTTCAIPPSQHTSAVINKFSFPRLGFLAIAIIGVLGGRMLMLSMPKVVRTLDQAVSR